MAHRAVLKLLSQKKNLTLGPFIRGTGIPVPCYPDLRGLLSDPEHLQMVAQECVPLVQKWKDIDCIGGCSMGGVPFATALSLATGLPMIILRKRARSHPYTVIEGSYRAKQRVLLVDDSIVTGASHQAFVENLLAVRLKPVRLLTIMDVGVGSAVQTKRAWITNHGIDLYSLVTWTEWALYMRDEGRIPRATVRVILRLMERPPVWAQEQKKISPERIP